MHPDDDLPAGADERCGECGRYVDACNVDPCLPDPDEEYAL